MNKNKSLNDKQIKDMERIKEKLLDLYLSPERYKDTSSNVSLLLAGMIKNAESILSYCKDS